MVAQYLQVLLNIFLNRKLYKHHQVKGLTPYHRLLHECSQHSYTRRIQTHLEINP